MTNRVVRTKLLIQTDGNSFAPPDGKLRLGIFGGNLETKYTTELPGIALAAPFGDELLIIRDSAWRPISSQGALVTARARTSNDTSVSDTGIGNVVYNHLIEYSLEDDVNAADYGEVIRTGILLTVRGFYIVSLYVAYGVAGTISLSITDGATALAATDFGSQTSAALHTVVYFTDASAAATQQIDFVYTHSVASTYPLTIRTAIIKVSDLNGLA